VLDRLGQAEGGGLLQETSRPERQMMCNGKLFASKLQVTGEDDRQLVGRDQRLRQPAPQLLEGAHQLKVPPRLRVGGVEDAKGRRAVEREEELLSPELL
jgi:hypothetical protein